MSNMLSTIIISFLKIISSYYKIMILFHKIMIPIAEPGDDADSYRAGIEVAADMELDLVGSYH